MFYVYILRNLKGRLYIGYTTDLRQRFRQHNDGLSIATKPYRPWKLLFYEAYISTKDAKRREMYLKTAKGRTTIKTMLTDSLTKPL
ncbi:MAG: GIY-YIG nuclease family protein [Candidatus Doudnabacteria bacterium]|nr:GIY-YIG nuclease family protein [Candidatus Doudnabacteria bacterium]